MPDATTLPAAAPESPVTFQVAFKRELQQVALSRALRNKDANIPVEESLTGLAFSGGGIRSATFNLGVLQGLAESKLLRQFDYISTVSGGGYIGGWLAALTRRWTKTVPGSTFADVENALVPKKYDASKRNEPTFLHWLRMYSDYLTPHTGLISGDTWAMIGTWMRNVFLNQTILGLFFVGLFTLCHAVVLGLERTQDHVVEFMFAGGFLLLVAAVSMGANVVDLQTSEDILDSWFKRAKVTITVLIPLVVASLLLNCGLWRSSRAGAAIANPGWFDIGDAPMWQWAAGGAAFYFLVWGLVGVIGRLRRRKKVDIAMVSFSALLLYSSIAGALGGCLFRGYWHVLALLPERASMDWFVAVAGTGLVMCLLLCAGSLHLGLVGRGCMDLVREWWSRLGGYLALWTLTWILLAGTCAFGPLGVRWSLAVLGGWKSLSAGVLWILHNYLGVKAASSACTSGKPEKLDQVKAGKCVQTVSRDSNSWMSKVSETLKSPRAMYAIAKAAPYVFIVGLALLLSTAVHIAAGLAFDQEHTVALWRLTWRPDWQALSSLYWQIQSRGEVLTLFITGALLIIAGLALSRRVDVNDFSLHHFYRNRLVRCYMGASNPSRRAQSFTGFDPSDDIPLSEFAGDYPGPYPILNAALNLTGGEELGYATRRAKNFSFTPLYCGYDLRSPGMGVERFERGNGYVPSYATTETARSEESLTKMTSGDGIALGTAVAISGAAASPNMGYFTSPATAFFMTLFDVRLGWWMGNSRYQDCWQTPGPAWGFSYLFSELLAQSDEKKRYVYLSDGGHFENLAAYELIKRHCKLIVICDADCDGSYAFENLLDLIEKARDDFGTRIEIEFEKIRPESGRESADNFVKGTIYYDPENLSDIGTLIFVKTSMPLRRSPSDKADAAGDSNTDKPAFAIAKAAQEVCRQLPDDVWHYFDLHPTFPHQTTADQWFNELQFESYRALGEHIGQTAAAMIAEEMERTLVRPLAQEAKAG
jgi:Patatin-like phospholipase